MSKPNLALDVTSDQFDPLLAIYSDILPDGRANPFDNMNVAEAALRLVGNMELKLTRKQIETSRKATSKNVPSTSASTNLPPQRRFLPHQMPIKSVTTSKPGRNLLTNMESHTGPLAKLNEFMKSRQKVKVTVRKTNGIRGYLTGYVEAFDIHWNITLSNVLECWKRRKFKYTKSSGTIIGREPEDMTHRLKELGISLPNVNVKTSKQKNVECSRHLPLLVVRGEMIGIITPAV